MFKLAALAAINIDKPFTRWAQAAHEPSPDYGFLGPDTVSWRVWSYPSSVIQGFQRAVTIEHLDPNLAASVVDSGGVKSRPYTRYDRTMRYFAMQIFGDTERTAKAADVLVKVHSKGIGHDPVTGGEYDANDPDSQLWIHVTAWHSILYCYEQFGGTPLTEEEDRQYWQECALIAQLQTIDPADVPRSREEVREYFEAWRPRLANSEAAQDMVEFILQTTVALKPGSIPQLLTLPADLLARVIAMGTISTYPRHMRKMWGLRQPAIVDAAVKVPLVPFYRFLDANPVIAVQVLRWLTPSSVEIAAPAVLGIEPLNPITMTPREAQAAYGYDRPADAHPALRTKQRARVFGEGVRPSDEGLIESEAIIGAMDAGAR